MDNGRESNAQGLPTEPPHPNYGSLSRARRQQGRGPQLTSKPYRRLSHHRGFGPSDVEYTTGGTDWNTRAVTTEDEKGPGLQHASYPGRPTKQTISLPRERRRVVSSTTRSSRSPHRRGNWPSDVDYTTW